MRAACRVCHRDTALTRRGLVWHHLARPALVRCPGAGHPPTGAPLSGPEPVALPGQWVGPPPWLCEHDRAGTVYLLHFDAPFGHARHYLGYATPGNLGWRLAHHAAGTGANLLRHVSKAGIGWSLARTWPGDRTLERAMKNHGHARRCPRCRPELDAKLRGAPPPPADSVCA